MRTIRVSRSRLSARALADAVAVLRSGGAVVFPTETAYGLAADPLSPRAVENIFMIKGRGAEKQLPLVAGSFAAAERVVRLPPRLRRLVRRRWPAPLTAVAPLRRGVRLASAGRRPVTAAIRVPSSAWARGLAAAFGRPVTSTSANLSGRPSLYSAAAVRREFSGRRRRPDLVLDAGVLPRRPPSTIVREDGGALTVLRQGAVRISPGRK